MAPNATTTTKVGPWGGNAGDAWDTLVVDHICNIKVYYIDAIVALDFTYTINGVKKTLHVGAGPGPEYKELNLDSDEYVIAISGQFRKMWNADVIITQLTLHTSKGQSLEAGRDETGIKFSFTVPVDDKIVGFFGAVSKPSVAIEAIGVYWLHSN